MGESKRRRLLDANYGKSKTPYSRQKITCEILNQQTAQEIASVYDFIIDDYELTKHHLSLPPLPKQNDTPDVINIIDAHQNPNSQLAPNHWHEWVVNSGVDPTLTELNVRSLSGDKIYEYLLYALPHTARRNDGRLRDGYLQRYAHINSAWWASGLDPLNN
jgi:hypothetical protein